MRAPLAILLMTLLVAGCAGRASKHARNRRAAVASSPGEPIHYREVRDAIVRCERASRPTFPARGKVAPPDPKVAADECGAAMQAAESAVAAAPTEPEAAALVILALSAAEDSSETGATAGSGGDKERRYCRRAEPWFRDRYRKTGAPDEAFRLHCPKLADAAYASAVAGERSLAGTFQGFATGDYTRLLLQDDRGKAHELWCLRGCPPFDADETGYLGKRIKVYSLREKTNLPETGKAVERNVFLRGALTD